MNPFHTAFCGCVLILTVFNGASACTGGSTTLYSYEQCCSEPNVIGWTYDVHIASGHSAEVWIQLGDNVLGTPRYGDSHCEVEYDMWWETTTCGGSACTSSTSRRCRDSGSTGTPENKLCLYMDCDNYATSCDVNTVSVTWEYAPTPDSSPPPPSPPPPSPPPPTSTDNSATSQCSPGCPKEWLSDGECDDECNTESCNFDSGDCADSDTDSDGSSSFSPPPASSFSPPPEDVTTSTTSTSDGARPTLCKPSTMILFSVFILTFCWAA